MNITKTKLWIAASALAIILSVLIVIIAVQQGQISKLTSEINNSNSAYAEEIYALESALYESAESNAQSQSLEDRIKELSSKAASLRVENDSLKEENEKLQQYQLSASAPSEYTVAIDRRLDPGIMELIERHISAIETGNLSQYKATLLNPNNNYLLGYFEQFKNTHIEITAIGAPFFVDAGKFQAGYIGVEYRKDGELAFYGDIGVTQQNGNWAIYDYD